MEVDVGGDEHRVVTFRLIDDDHTRIMLQLDIEPEGAVEKVGDALGIAKRRVKSDLENFKKLIEEHGTETGGWVGTSSSRVRRPGRAAGLP